MGNKKSKNSINKSLKEFQNFEKLVKNHKYSIQKKQPTIFNKNQ